MSNQIGPLLAQNSDQVMQNLADSEKKLTEVNQKLVDLVNQYNNLNKSDDWSVFFDVSTIYFWLIIGGLFLLSLGLLLLRSELKKPKDKIIGASLSSVEESTQEETLTPEPVVKIKSVKEVIAEEEQEEAKEEEEEEPTKPKPKKSKRVVKIKVVKVK